MKIYSAYQGNYMNFPVQNNKSTNTKYSSAATVQFKAIVKPQNIFQRAINVFKLQQIWKKYIKQESNWNLLNAYIDNIQENNYNGIKRAKEILDKVPQKFRPMFEKSADEIRSYEDSAIKK